VPATTEPSPTRPIHRQQPAIGGPVVVGFDGSASAGRALEFVAGAMADSARLVVVAVEPQVHSRGLLAEPLLRPQVEAAELLDIARCRLGSLAERIRLESISMAGDPAAVLVEVARDAGATLLVVGGRGDDFEARVLLGSVAERVVQDARCNVLIVR
jgi:nucleotide-binding universal stress UspA family protein